MVCLAYSAVTWLLSGLVAKPLRLEADVPGVAGAANAMTLHRRQRSSKMRYLGIMFAQSSSQVTAPMKTSSEGSTARYDMRYALYYYCEFGTVVSSKR